MNIFLYRMRNMTGKGSWASPLIVQGTLMEQESILGGPSPKILSKDWLSFLGSVAYSWIHQSWPGVGCTLIDKLWVRRSHRNWSSMTIYYIIQQVSIECSQCARSSSRCWWHNGEKQTWSLLWKADPQVKGDYLCLLIYSLNKVKQVYNRE